MITYALIFLINGNAFVMDTGLSEADCVRALLKVPEHAFVCESERPL